MKKTLHVALAGLLILFSCDDDDQVRGCVRGTVIGFEHCSNGILIQVEASFPIGKTVTYNGASYDNVVKAPSPSGDYRDTFYFRYRAYSAKDDYHLFGPPVPCLAIYAPYDVPTIVITAAAKEPCAAGGQE